MKRYQIYPSNELDEIVTREAARKGVSISAEIMEKLEMAYGIINETDTMAFSELVTKIRSEVDEYVLACINNDLCTKEFTLYKASKTFAEISMADDAKRLVSMKPRIGKAFRKLVDDKVIKNVKPLRKVNGEQKREHNAAVYVIDIDE